ncbi:MAG: cytochrome c oxidase subunit 4, partial [Longispora sp.]|nr:cytochrome c oxidase subunit 4 [Longispora sp. (in: high G+C Gram-positive bacteria)]
GTLLAMCAAYFWFVARRIDLRPEDRPDGEIHEGAGEVGFFSPGSYWPLGVALAVAVIGIGFVYWMVWLIVVGAIAILGATAGLLFEYYTGATKQQNIHH